MKYTLGELNLNISMKDLEIDVSSTNIEDIMKVISRSIQKVLYNNFDMDIPEVEIDEATDLQFAKEELDTVVYITDIIYALEDEEVAKRNLPNTLDISLKDLDINYYNIDYYNEVEDNEDIWDAIDVALNRYFINNGYAKKGEDIIYTFNYSFVER